MFSLEYVRARLTARQFEKALSAARAKHRKWYAAMHPPPTPEDFAQHKPTLRRVFDNMPKLFLAMAVVAAVWSALHVGPLLASTSGYSDVSAGLFKGDLAVLYAVVAFLGMEVTIVLLAFVSAFYYTSQNDGQERQWSLAGLVNGLLARVGLTWRLDVSHLPRKRATATWLVGFLMAANVLFNVANALRHASLISPHMHMLELVVAVVAGIVAPILLFVAGHEAATEIARQLRADSDQDTAYRAALETYQVDLETDWQEQADDLVAEQASRYSKVSADDFQRWLISANVPNVPGRSPVRTNAVGAQASATGSFGFGPMSQKNQNASKSTNIPNVPNANPNIEKTVQLILNNPDMARWSQRELAAHPDVPYNGPGSGTSQAMNDPRVKQLRGDND